MTHTIIETLNAVRILQRDDGRYGIEDLHSGQITFRYRTLDAAHEVARQMSLENDHIDAYSK